MTGRRSSGNVFKDIGFTDPEAEILAAKADLASLVARAIRVRNLTQKEAAFICNTEQGTLSKILSGKLTSITIDRLAKFLIALGCDVNIDVKPHQKVGRPESQNQTIGEMTVSSA